MPRILHFGIGNFHRAHQAWYTELANRTGGSHWKITGVSMQSSSVKELMQPQNFDYTLAVSGPENTTYNRMKVIDNILVSGADTRTILAQIVDPETKIITLTVTEKGYHLHADSGELNLSDPAIRSDMNGTTESIYGFLAQGLQQRRAHAAGPITILSCDNLSANGDTLAAAMRAFAAQFDPSLPAYLADNVTFPNCMVDRITPATTQETRADVAANTGWADCAPVATEAFSEWIIEDRFCTKRPDWDGAGARFVPNVAPFELRKLRLLNGAHSYLAYAGILRGHTYVHEAISDPVLRAGAAAIMSEATETLPSEIRATAPDYAASLLARFSNPGLHHKLRQIAMDGTQKLPIRLVATWKDREALGLASPIVEAAIASWIVFVRSETIAGRDLQDPAAASLAEVCKSARSILDLSTELCALIGAPDEIALSSGLLDCIKGTSEYVGEV